MPATTTDLVILLIAGILGTLGMATSLENRAINLGWLVFTIWCILKLVRVL